MLFGFSTVSVDITNFNGIDLEHKSIPLVDGLDAIYKAVINHWNRCSIYMGQQ